MCFDMGSDIKVVSFGRIVQKKGFWHEVWYRNNYLLFYLSQGNLTMQVDGKKYKLSTGDVLLLPPKTNYKPLESNGCVYYHIDFTAPPTEYTENNFAISSSPCKNDLNFSYSYAFGNRTVIALESYISKAEASGVDEILKKCAELDIWRRPYEKMLLDNYLKEMLIRLSILKETSSDVEQRFNRMVWYIERNYKNNIGLKEVSEAAHISLSYAAKLFRKNAGMRCCDYINRVRLGVACGMLTNTYMQIGDIAAAVGFRSQYYFSRQFKETYGMTASDFRRNSGQEV